MLHTLKIWIDLAHRWLGLLVLLQVLFWSAGGLVIYFLDFSDLYREPPAQALNLGTSALSFQALEQKLRQAGVSQKLTGFKLVQRGGSTWFQVQPQGGTSLLLTPQGDKISPLQAGQIADFAKGYYTGQGSLQTVEKLASLRGNYYSDAPLWRVRFADSVGTEIYLEPQTGELLARRKAIWGLYNWMWELHLTKYTPWPAFNKALLAFLAVLNMMVALTGLFKFFRWGRKRMPPVQIV
ncbi:hypothetical protein COW36_17475 [bacterium (Candidatus Blackallbacteria) CG17_big_fil_post_rev_8_21_14_2_50_48_46]|uniref:PepSY domain-containing protein n=1 Tax=bacterium (Candidatus Blackallbacteria) CG17_big_fil_post_rev_8_21_14_2_50_48_46 TaxID=2014261 RepID=A0A2M7G0J6_9BACT|nr:MAG: hypothetical protein COW64_01255 [bacterium (Candidatus Blackallbacteria) CG18_big_fil_WC_8_21_14_2_50_49_26]PIW15212.1 MAG: hypothetical protein COW36_17475 [bacterium (Candidatus Blackallbacteria) CG17_big_fil_post_rev_8_21_14_2_50_48_46]PIW44799.1 MAG: hypothetical protein COW20_22810 [bacterium (Candidatus Blackallbacteria) CG13_big_fil_rev_8_21_14_2_50_49_14]